MNRATRWAIWAEVGALAVGLAPLLAQEKKGPEAESQQLEELVVQSEPDTPDLFRDLAASVSTSGAERLRANGVAHVEDLVGLVPGLTATGGTSRARFYEIRGIGQNSEYEGETPDDAVRFLMDDLDFTGMGAAAATFDIDRVEILRGPQVGTVAANVAGGQVRVRSVEPTPYWTGQAMLSAGTHGLWRGGLAVGGPLLKRNPEELMLRFSVEHGEDDGFRRNLVFNKHTNARDEWFSRLHLRWNPHPDLRVDTTLFYGNQDNGYDEWSLHNSRKFSYSDQPGRDDQNSVAASVRVTWDGWDRLRASAVSSFTYTDWLYSYDGDWTSVTDPLSTFQDFAALNRLRKVFSQELRLESAPAAGSWGWVARWTTGLWFSLMDESSGFRDDFSGTIDSLNMDYRALRGALFGELGWDVGRAGKLTLGGRIEHARFRGTGVTGVDGVVDPPLLRPEVSDTLAGAKLSYTQDLSEHAQLYATVAAGYRPGGINTDAHIDVKAGDPLTYRPERLFNYEAGVRGALLDGRLRGSMTAYYTSRRRVQMADAAGLAGTYRYFTDNAGRGEVYGVEMEGSLRVAGDLELYGSLGFMGSDSQRAVMANGSVWGGGRLANTPDHSYSIGLRYQPEQGFFGNLEVLGRSGYTESANKGERLDAFDVLNASLGYRHGDWSLSLWGRNLLDNDYARRVFFFANGPPWVDRRYVAAAYPRQIGVTLRRTF